MAVGTRSTPDVGNDATNDNTAGGGGNVNMTGGSLSAGTGSATLGYNANTLYALYFVTVILLLRIKYFAGSSSSSKYEAVACMILTGGARVGPAGAVAPPNFSCHSFH